MREFTKRSIDDALDELAKEGWQDSSEDPTDLIKEMAEKEKEAVPSMVNYLKRIYGEKLAAKLCSEPQPYNLRKWVKGESRPNEWQHKFLRQACEVTQILGLKVPPKGIKAWVLTPCDYLAGFRPVDLLVRDAEGVKMAALDYLMS